MLCFDLRKKK